MDNLKWEHNGATLKLEYTNNGGYWLSITGKTFHYGQSVYSLENVKEWANSLADKLMEDKL